MTDGVYVDVEQLVKLRYAGQRISFLPRQPVKSLLAGRRASKLRGRGLDFEELRKYQRGDDIRTLDWKVTARMREPFVRVYREERERPVLLVVDQRSTMFFGSRQCMKSVVAAEAAAIAAWRVLGASDRVGALVFGDDGYAEFKPRRSAAHVTRILATVAEYNQRLSATTARLQPETSLERALERVMRLAPHDVLVVVFSDLAGSGPRARELATAIRRHNDMIIAFVDDPLEASLPDVGKVVLSDGEQQIEVDTADPDLRERFAADFEDRRTRAESIALKYDVPTLRLTTDGNVPGQIQRALGHLPRGRR